MYDDLPETVRRSNPPGGGRDLEEKMDAARQVDIRQRLQRERRERVNYYLDLAVRLWISRKQHFTSLLACW